MTAPRDGRWLGMDPLGLILCAAAGLALAAMPLVLFKANRIVPGEPRAIADVLPTGVACAFYALIALVAVVVLCVRNPHARLWVALAGLAATAMVVAAAAKVFRLVLA